MNIDNIISHVSVERLKAYLKNLEGLRHGSENYQALEEKADFIEETLRSFNLTVENQKFDFNGKTYRNIIATLEGCEGNEGWLLLGAHYDAAMGSPGADDNASGVAVMLEAAGILNEHKFHRTIQFVAFTLEEPQPHTVHFLIGSSHFANEAYMSKKRYKAVLILESVGYTDEAEGSQVVPLFIRTPVPRKGNFLGVVANKRSKSLMKDFQTVSNIHVPELLTVSYKVPFSGRMIPETRFSDHAPFWNHGYPALMLTDTAMFRNPHYHTHHDRFETLDFNFMANVTKAVASALLEFGK